jgi:hypothetical protein
MVGFSEERSSGSRSNDRRADRAAALSLLWTANSHRARRARPPTGLTAPTHEPALVEDQLWLVLGERTITAQIAALSPLMDRQ